MSLFEVDIDLTRTGSSTSFSLCAEFFLRDPDLCALVENSYAKYVLLVSSPKARFRKAFETVETKLGVEFTAGELADRVHFSAFLIATRRTKSLDWNGWNNDCSGLEVEIEPGSVLAVEEPKSYWIDREDEAPLGSIFVHKPSSDIQDERWMVNLEAERVEILMSHEVSDLYKSVRERLKDEMDVQYLMNSLYLPALIKVLYEADRNAEDYEEYRWFSALDNLLHNQGCHKLGSQKADRFSDAQKLLQLPFAKTLRLLNRETMKKLKYHTLETVENLRQKVHLHLEWYYSGESLIPDLSSLGGIRESSLEISQFESNLFVDPSKPSSSDPENALIVYNALRSLTPHQASLECLWVYLSHCVCEDYVRKRWLAKRPSDDAKAARDVRNHFFAEGTRALIRDNGVSRLWWLGKTAHDVAPNNPAQFLRILLFRQDVRSALLERPSLSMNVRVLRGIYKILREDWQAEKKLLERFTFRDWMKALNRRGGVILLDSLPDRELEELLRSEAERALRENQSG